MEGLFEAVIDVVQIMVKSLSSFQIIGPLSLMDIMIIGAVVALIMVNFVRGGD